MYLIFSFNIGGIERLLVDLCDGMAQRDNNIFLCIINKDYTDSILSELSPNIHIIKLDKTPGKKTMSLYMHKFARIVIENKIQIIHCQGINCVLFSALAKIISPKTIVINTVHDIGNYSSYPYAKIMLQNIICSMTIAISTSVRKEILTRNIQSNKVVTIYNAIDTDKFKYIMRDTSIPLRNRQVIRITNVARFFPIKKGQDTLIKAIELLIHKYPAIACSFAGDISKGQEKIYNKTIDYVTLHHLNSHVKFLGNVDNIPKLLKDTDIFVLPSNYEGFGISLIEALATGLPCIASDLQGPSEIINSTSYGLLSAPGDFTSLADNIDKMITNYEKYNFGSISQDTLNRFSIDGAIEKHLSLYQDLIAKTL